MAVRKMRYVLAAALPHPLTPPATPSRGQRLVLVVVPLVVVFVVVCVVCITNAQRLASD